MYIAGAPKKSREAWSIAASSHGASAGAFQPVLAFSSSTSTRAPFGGSAISTRLTTSPAFFGSSVGGRRRLSFTAVCGRSTLPALDSGGMPSTPVIDSAGRHVRLSTSSARSSLIGVMPGRNGNLS